MAEALRMLVVLAVICGISGSSLAYLKQVTAPVIEEQVLFYVQGPAINKVYPAASNDPIAERRLFHKDGRDIVVFPYMQNGKLVGVALEAKGQGFGGEIGVMVGFNLSNDTLLGIGITEMRETPGLGTRIADNSFSGQFSGRGLDVELTGKGGKIDAVSGATVSSIGAVSAVKAASTDYLSLKDELTKVWQ